jgi:hypothetical protein
MLLLEGVVLVSLPLLFVFVPLAVAAWREKRADEARARQIAITDAIHRDVGALVAPTVEPRSWGPWRLNIPVPFERPEVVATVVDIAHASTRAYDRAAARDTRHALGRPRPMEIVLTPQEEETRACA